MTLFTPTHTDNQRLRPQNSYLIIIISKPARTVIMMNQLHFFFQKDENNLFVSDSITTILLAKLSLSSWTKPGARAAVAKTAASATGESFVPADESTVVVTPACTLEPVALWLAHPCLCLHRHFCSTHSHDENIINTSHHRN